MPIHLNEFDPARRIRRMRAAYMRERPDMNESEYKAHNAAFDKMESEEWKGFASQWQNKERNSKT